MGMYRDYHLLETSGHLSLESFRRHDEARYQGVEKGDLYHHFVCRVGNARRALRFYRLFSANLRRKWEAQ